MRSLAFSASVCLLLGACGDEAGSEDSGGSGGGDTSGGSADDGVDDGSGDDSGDDGDGSGDGADGSGDDDSGDGTSGADGGDDGSGDSGGGANEPARGNIVVTEVIADQGITVIIGRDGVGTPGAGPVELIQNRATLFRALWDVPADWTPRKIRGRITVHLPDGSQEEATQTLTIDGDADIAQIDKAFYWYLPAELVVPGLEYEVDLEEAENGHGGEAEPTVPPRLPTSGVADVGVTDSYMVMKVTLVPVEHDLSGRECSPAPVPTDSDVEVFRSELLAFNPTETVEMDVRSTYTFTQGMSDFGPLLSALSQLRSTDGAPPEQYYYGLVQPCDGGPMGVGGQAIGIPGSPSMGNAWQRTSLGRFSGTVTSAVSTFVHEVGHTQGRRHVYCSGQEGGPDPSYPYDGGEVGNWGFNIESWVLMSPILKDYMTYCGPVWVSDFGWNEVHPVIETLSSWDMGSVDRSQDTDLLIGALYVDGTEEWWTTPGALTPSEMTPGHSMEFVSAQGSIAVTPMMAARRPDSDVMNFAAPLPEGFDRVSTVLRRAPGKVKPSTVDVSRINQLHRR